MAFDDGYCDAQHGVSANGLGNGTYTGTRDAMSGVRRRTDLPWIRAEQNTAIGEVRYQLI